MPPSVLSSASSSLLFAEEKKIKTTFLFAEERRAKLLWFASLIICKTFMAVDNVSFAVGMLIHIIYEAFQEHIAVSLNANRRFFFGLLQVRIYIQVLYHHEGPVCCIITLPAVSSTMVAPPTSPKCASSTTPGTPSPIIWAAFHTFVFVFVFVAPW